MKRALIADDEPHGRQAVRDHLARAGDFAVVAECSDGDETLRTLQRGGIDVAFLDIRMPARSGLDVASALGDAAPLLVFVTAFDQHAIAAFDHCAVDYVLKPIETARFERTLARVRERLAADTDRTARLARLLDAMRWPANGGRIALSTPGRTLFVEAGDLLWAQASGNYVELHTAAGETSILRATLQQLERQLLECDFVRIHRAYMVGLRHVRELRSSDGGNTTSVRLRDGTELPVGRTYRDALARRLDAGGRAH